ncbi:MAG: RNA 3'-phosphate cyclase [Calditrichaeota bacterium]|nr:MAG: RNA 3'-phosphate cyclase [Calditrichota bacterium]
MITIDGAQKSGSGTIVRDAVPLAALTGRALHLINIRARRRPSGLRPQHLQAVRACAEMCEGGLKGDRVGSREIWFTPGRRIRGGYYRWDIGTAGSATMLAMCVLPLALFADAPVTLSIRGGLFQDFAPSAFHFQQVFLPTLAAMGATVRAEIVQPGYVPTGGGELLVQVEPLLTPLKPLVREQPGRVVAVQGVALASHLAERQVAHRMARSAAEALESFRLPVEIQELNDTREKPAFRRPAPQPGAALALWARTDTGCLLGMDMAGKVGRRAETIGKQVACRLLEDIEQGATVDRYLADQLIPFAALARGTSTYRIPQVTDHVAARLWLTEQLLGSRWRIAERQVWIEGIGREPHQ